MPDVDTETAQQSLGSFGTAREVAPVTLTFQWYGHTIRVNVDASELDLIEFMGAVGDLDERDPRAVPAMTTLLRRYVHPDDWTQFWQLARVNRADPREDFLPLVGMIAEATAGRPTVPPTGFTGGRAGTAPNSTPAVASAVLEGLASRGDLAEFVLMAQDPDYLDRVPG